MNAYQIVLKPLVTEKVIAQEGQSTYWFAVSPTANKAQIRQAIEEIYQVHVRKVHTLRQRGKFRRSRMQYYQKPEWKKAAVTIAAGERIDII
jgi:large subunit ribosomal protein L23